jgi:hypothetical protein
MPKSSFALWLLPAVTACLAGCEAMRPDADKNAPAPVAQDGASALWLVDPSSCSGRCPKLEAAFDKLMVGMTPEQLEQVMGRKADSVLRLGGSMGHTDYVWHSSGTTVYAGVMWTLDYATLVNGTKPLKQFGRSPWSR